MGYRSKKFEITGGASTINVGFVDGFDGKFIVHLKEGAGETVTISSVSQIFTNVAGTETAVAISTTAITAGKTVSYAGTNPVSSVLRVTLSGAPVSEDTVIEVTAQY